MCLKENLKNVNCEDLNCVYQEATCIEIPYKLYIEVLHQNMHLNNWTFLLYNSTLIAQLSQIKDDHALPFTAGNIFKASTKYTPYK